MYHMPQPIYQMPPQPIFGYQPYGYPQPIPQPYPQPISQPISQPTNYYGYNNYNHEEEEESEYEYITDDEGAFIEDEYKNIYTIEEAQKKGLIAPSNGVRGIKRKLLFGGGTILGGTYLLKKHLKKKKRVKKPSSNQCQSNSSSNGSSPQSSSSLYNYGQPRYGIGEVPSYMFNQPQYGYGQNTYIRSYY